MLIAGLGKLRDDVSAEGGMHYVKRITRGIKEREALVMLGGDDEILHPAFLSKRDPLVGGKIDRIEGGGDRLHLPHRDAKLRLDPFAVVIRTALSPVFSGKHGI